MIGAEIAGSPPGGVLFRTSRTCDPEIQVPGAKLTWPLVYSEMIATTSIAAG